MRISYTRTFQRAYRKLTQAEPALRDRIDAALARLGRSPGHPGLRIHAIRSWPGCYEARVTDAVRVVFARQGDEIVLLAVGRHDVLP